MRLTAEQRAEKIFAIFTSENDLYTDKTDEELTKEIAAQIEEAEREALAEGKRFAYEDAAKIADYESKGCPPDCFHWIEASKRIASVIRKRAGELTDKQ